jgi:hypothetical protein
LRAYLRQRERLVEYAAAHIQHMQKALMEMNLQLHHVVSDITGATGMRIIRAIVAGERRPDVLATHRDVRCHASMETIRASLTGNDRDEHVFALRQSLELYDTYQSKIAECDRELEASISALIVEGERPAKPLSKARVRTKQVNAPTFDVRAALYGMLGVDLTQIHGLGPSLALKLVSECGRDLKAWPSAKHFTSWLCLAPGNKISGERFFLPKRGGLRAGPRPCCDWRRRRPVEQTQRLGLSTGGCLRASASPKPSQPRRGRSRCCSTMPFVMAWNTRIPGRITMTSDTVPAWSPTCNAAQELWATFWSRSPAGELFLRKAAAYFAKESI